MLNKYDKRGAEDALRDIRKQWKRNPRGVQKRPMTDIPVYPTIASQFNDPGVSLDVFGAVPSTCPTN